MLPENVDHLVYAAPDLEQGRDEIERLLGVRPVVGGRHAAWGTRNALLSLGPETYLEVIAPDPGQRPPDRGVLFGADALETSRLVTWVLRSRSIDVTAAAASVAGIGLGPVAGGSRETPAGEVLSWKLTDPYAMPLGGAIPFLIEWGETPHPAGALPNGGTLVGLRIEHPDRGRTQAALAALGVELPVLQGDTYGLTATIRTPTGDVELK